MKQKHLKGILIGLGNELAARLRIELDELDAPIEAEFPEIPSAIASLLLTLGETRVFLVHVTSADDLPALKRLADVFTGHPILALVDGEADRSLFLGVNRHGATQVVPLPLQRDDFQTAMQLVAQQYGGPRGKAEVLAVAGVTGGCGATAIASNLAYEVAHLRDRHCILVELSLQLGKLAHYFDVEPQLTTQDLFKDVDQLHGQAVEQALTRIAENFSILPGPYKSLTPVSVNSDSIRRLVHCTRRLTNVVVLDIPCTLDDHYFEVLGTADRIVLVCEQKIPSLRSLKLVCEALDRQYPVRPRIQVINRYNPKTPGLSVAKLEEVLKTTGFQTISNDFASMNATLNHGRPLRIEAPRSRALADIHALARVLFPEIGESTGRATGMPFFAHLSRRLGKTAIRH